MDKETLSHYGWIVILTLILSVLLALGTPFGKFVAQGAGSILKGYANTNNKVLSNEHMDGLRQEFEDYINSDSTPGEDDNIGNLGGADDGIGDAGNDDENTKLECGHDATDEGDHTKKDCGHFNCDEEDCGCDSVLCGIEGHYVGDGRNHTLASCEHYNCACICFTIPEGGLYTSTDGTVYNPGETVKDLNVGDIYRYGDYEYCYGKYSSRSSWVTAYGASLRDGWGVRAINKTKTTYDELLTAIRDKNIIDMSSCFEDCTKMTTAPEIPETVDTLSNTFDGCSSLTTVGKLPDGITGLYQTFYCCTKLENVPELPDSIKSLNFTFFGCRSLKTVKLPPNLTSLYQTFYYCTAMTEAPEIPETVTYMRAAFTSSGLVHAPKLPDNVQCLAAAFSGCEDLIEAPVIPASVTEMGNIFSDCTSLKGNVEINAESTSYSNAFSEIDFTEQDIVLTGTSPLLDKIGATGWRYCPECNSGCKNFTEHEKPAVTYSTVHNGYQESNTRVFGKWDFRGAKSVTITLTYQTHYKDRIYIYSPETGYLNTDGTLSSTSAAIYSNSPNPSKATVKFENVDLLRGEIKFVTASTNTSYWGFEITVTPNY